MISDKEFENILHKILHEIRNPLTVASSSLEILADRYPLLLKEYFYQVLDENIKYMADLTLDFTNFLVEHRYNPTTFYFDELAKKIALSFATLIIERDITFTSKIDLENFSYYGDAVQMQQLFRNILQNSAEAITGHGEVFFHVFADEDNIIVDISDTGCGIEDDVLPNIFNLHVSTKKDHGKGQGLPICKEIIKVHHGQIEVTSTSSEGTTFRVTLPTKYECGEESGN